ncbi:hypothetical protein K474DRAFT_861356 [Panus rudis PR-1116 ss-1]|nr:hypothetical protein K474DRAFT_861356 [Panus rudis PR-1116 ss-1]
MDISLRHLPDTSGISQSASFELPGNAEGASNLLADDSIDFFQGMNDALATPTAKRTAFYAPLTLEELTPRSERMRKHPARSPSKSRPVIPSPLKRAVAQELSSALEEELPPPRTTEESFAIPSGRDDDLLTNSFDFSQSGPADISLTEELPLSSAHDPLTLSQLSPASRPVCRSPSPVPASSGTVASALFEENLPGDQRQGSANDFAGSVPGPEQAADIHLDHTQQPPDSTDAHSISQSESSAPKVSYTKPSPLARATKAKREPTARAIRVLKPKERVSPKASNTARSRHTVISGRITKPGKPSSSAVARGLSKTGKDHRTAPRGHLAGNGITNANDSRSPTNLPAQSRSPLLNNPSDMPQPTTLAAALMSYGHSNLIAQGIDSPIFF